MKSASSATSGSPHAIEGGAQSVTHPPPSVTRRLRSRASSHVSLTEDAAGHMSLSTAKPPELCGSCLHPALTFFRSAGNGRKTPRLGHTCRWSSMFEVEIGELTMK